MLRRNGTFLAFRKFRMNVAAFRKYLREQTSSPEEEELIAAKMVGRWRSGAPLALASERDDPKLGADADRNNNFSYDDDMQGLRCPFSAHIRRVNPARRVEERARRHKSPPLPAAGHQLRSSSSGRSVGR